MKKFIKLDNNIAYRYGVVDNIPENIDKAKDEFKVDKFITKDEFKTLYNKFGGCIQPF